MALTFQIFHKMLIILLPITKYALHIIKVAEEHDQTKYNGEINNSVNQPPRKKTFDETFNCVLSCNHLKYREVRLILYQNDQAYPEYVINFKRSTLTCVSPTERKSLQSECRNILSGKIK